MNKIITVNVYPPIPDRRFDWCAYHDGEEELNRGGWGRTEAEALEDLRRMDEERQDSEADYELVQDGVFAAMKEG